MAERTLDEWRDYLLPLLAKRIETNTFLRAMYDGNHPLPTSPNRTNDKYIRLAQMAITNLCGLIVDAPVSKLTPKGVRLTETGDEDLELWRRVWKANRLNARCRVAHEEALKVGRSFALVWPMGDGVSVTVEDADQVIVAYAPGSTTERLAALKWYNCDGYEYATVWTPTEVYSWYRTAPPSTAPIVATNWEPDPNMKGGPNPLGRVPVVELLCKPDAKGNPAPELSTSVLWLQTNLNKTKFDIVVAGEDGAFPQRATIGIEIPTDKNGNATNPLKAGPDKVWALNSQDPENPDGGRIEQFPAYDTSNLLATVDAIIRQMGWISRTSAIFMLGGASNVGADMIRALDNGHMAKVLAHQVVLGEAWEEVFALSMIAMGQTPPDDMEIDWVSPEFGSPAEMADAAIKLRQVGYSFKAIARYMGASPAEVTRLVAEGDAEPVVEPAAV